MKIIIHIDDGSRLIQYGLDDDNDDVANYLILSLQTDQIVPQLSETVLTLRFIYADSFNTFNIENYIPCSCRYRKIKRLK